ncbi:hypothetical protein F4859DRAFT_177269 [Xylaria cf. heliscus]|nr:hypothetical protein F4859DRAFT_177269 [Xylaria cf. heliscus]
MRTKKGGSYRSLGIACWVVLSFSRARWAAILERDSPNRNINKDLRRQQSFGFYSLYSLGRGLGIRIASLPMTHHFHTHTHTHTHIIHVHIITITYLAFPSCAG